MGAHYATDHQRLGLLALEAIGLVVALGYLAGADPHDSAVAMPRCPVKWATGWDCPSCGGLRMVHDLLHGEFGKALDDNILMVVISPLLLYLLYQQARAMRTGEPYEVPKPMARGLLALACAWGIVRNRPGWPWKPAPSGSFSPTGRRR